MEFFVRKIYGFCFLFFEIVDLVLGIEFLVLEKYIFIVFIKVCDVCIDDYL